MIQKHIISDQGYIDHIRNIRGSFAIEGMNLHKNTELKLSRIARGEQTYQQVLEELRKQYKKDK